MYIPTAFAESDLAKQHDFIEQNGFGLLVSQVEGLPFVSHLPFLLDKTAGPHGCLLGHMARANPQWAEAGDQDVLAVFSGPHAYVSPTWYEDENVVPTWNYVAVHAYGRLQIVREDQDLARILERFVAFYEATLPRPWRFDAASDFSKKMMKAVVGFRIKISRIEGKWKLNQNRPREQRERVARTLRTFADDNARGVASLIEKDLQAPS
jgi:transcriptional regulator